MSLKAYCHLMNLTLEQKTCFAFRYYVNANYVIADTLLHFCRAMLCERDLSCDVCPSVRLYVLLDTRYR